MTLTDKEKLSVQRALRVRIREIAGAIEWGKENEKYHHFIAEGEEELSSLKSALRKLEVKS